MAGFVKDHDGVSQVLQEEVGDRLDEDMIEYLCGIVSECDDVGTDGQGLVELLSPFLESYGVVESEEEAEAMAKKIGKKLLKEVKQEQVVAKTEIVQDGPKKLAQAIQASTLDTEEDTWGLKDVKNKNKANTTVESISDAIGDKKSQERLKKKLEKDRKKEEKLIEKEERERARMMEVEFGTSAPNGAPSSNTSSNQDTNEAIQRRTKQVQSRDVYIPNVTITIGTGKLLLEDAELRIVAGRRYGLIGKNGSGKTTLLKHVSHRLLEGFPTNISIVHVEQEVHADETPVIDAVLKADTERERLLKEEKRLMDLIDKGSTDAKVNDDLRKVYDQLVAIGAESAESRARKILGGLGFTEEMQNKSTKALSGGWRMRSALARALFLEPDLLLLDEPGNHIDFEALIWLENHLQNYRKTLMIVSHDRMFINNVITDVIHLENQKLHYYKGDIDTFERTRANQRLQQQREFEAQQAKRAHMQKFVDRFRYNAKRASLAQSRIKALDRMELVDEVIDDPEFRFSFPEPISELNKIIEVQTVSFGYPEGENGEIHNLFEDVDMSIFATSRIGLLGANGTGKTTLLKVIRGELQPQKGYVQTDPKARIAFFTQHHVDQLNLRQSPLEYLLETFHGSKPDEVRSHLARYGVPAEMATQRIGTMSGGQKSRVAFAKITWDRPHLIFLDEPSNHCDLETVQALIIAINTFDGGIVFITHDQYLLEMCAEELWVIKDKKCFQYRGTVEDYKREVLPKD